MACPDLPRQAIFFNSIIRNPHSANPRASCKRLLPRHIQRSPPGGQRIIWPRFIADFSPTLPETDSDDSYYCGSSSNGTFFTNFSPSAWNW